MRILLLGSNPSTSSPNNGAFDYSTKSGRTLATWIARVGCYNCILMNVSPVPTTNNKPLTVRDIKANLGRLAHDIGLVSPDKIVAVGKTAVKALTLLGLTHFELPHPSGCNRLLNNPDYIDEKIKKLQSYLELP